MSSNTIVHGNCLDVLKTLPDNSIDLVVTSPPYADARRTTYGGPKPDDYVTWFEPIAKELHRVLKSDGTFILNIKEKVVNSERHTYVLELILALRKQGWLWTEEWCWHKKNSSPGKWPNRFRDSWERLLQFNKSKSFVMNQDDVKVPIGDWAQARLKKLSEKDSTRSSSNTKSGFGKNIANWVGRDTVYPTNVLHLATECGDKEHPAAFPQALPEFFIKLFSPANGLVLDPFSGSGTTCFVANKLGRQFLGIELSKDYYKASLTRLRLPVPPENVEDLSTSVTNEHT